MATNRNRCSGIEEHRKSLGHQERTAGRAAYGLNPADQIDVRPYHREIEPLARADVAVADFSVVQCDTGVAVQRRVA